MFEPVIVFFAKSTIVLVIALAVCSLRRLSAGERHAIATTSLVAVALLAVVTLLSDHIRIAGLAVALPAVELLPIDVAEPLSAVTEARGAVENPAPLVASSKALNWWAWGLGVYAAVAIVLGASTLAGRRRVADYVRRLPVWSEPRLVPDHVDVRLDERGTPWTWGHRYPVIVLPREFQTWPRDRQQAVLAHELGHIRRRDCLMDALSRLLCNVFWLQPLMWVLWLRQRRYAEQACDDAALAEGADPCDYAETLLAVAHGNRGAKAMGLSVGRSAMRLRLRSILRRATRRTPMTLAGRLTLMSLATLLVLTFGASTVATARVGNSAVLGGPQLAGESTREIYVYLRLPLGHAGPTVDDAEAIATRLANVTRASPYYSSHVSVFAVRHGDRDTQAVVIVQEDLSPRAETSARAVWPLDAGHYLTASDDLDGERAAVIGGPIRDALFGAEATVIGEEVLIGGEPFRIKGVLAPHPPFVNVDLPAPEHAANALGKRVYVPFGIGSRLFFPDERPGYLRVAVEDEGGIQETAAEIREFLERRYGDAAEVMTETLTVPLARSR